MEIAEIICCLVLATNAATGGMGSNEAMADDDRLLDAFELRGRVVDATPDITEAAFQLLEGRQKERIEDHKRRWPTLEDYTKYLEELDRKFEACATEEDRKKLASTLPPIEFHDLYLPVWGPRPVSNALVTVRGSSFEETVTTDGEGNFRVVGLVKGEYELLAEAFSHVAGRKATGRIRWRFIPGREKVYLKVHAYPITIAGRVTAKEGAPVAGARVSVGPALVFHEFDYDGDPYKREELRDLAWRHEISTLSSADGSYIVTGIQPPDLHEIVRYLSGGEKSTYAYHGQCAMSLFFAQVRVEASEFRQWNDVIVPLVVEPLTTAARRMRKVMHQARVEMSNDLGEGFLRELGAIPQSRECTIYGIDIVLQDATIPAPQFFRIEGTVWDLTRDLSEEHFIQLEGAYASAMKKAKECEGLSGAQRAKRLEVYYRRYIGIWTNMIDRKRGANAAVALRGNSVQQQVVARADGRFRFVDIPEGEYEISAEAPPRGRMEGVARGKKRIHLVPGMSRSQEVSIDIHAKPKKIRGRITTADGQPVAGARVTGGPACLLIDVLPQDSARFDRGQKHARQYDLSTVSDVDGSYELDGFMPPFLLDVADYLAGGAERMIKTNSLWHPFSPFFAEVHVDAAGLVQRKEQVPRVPLVTGGDVHKARRLAAVYLSEALQLLGRSSRPITKTTDESVTPFLPSSDEDVITGIDIIMERSGGSGVNP